MERLVGELRTGEARLDRIVEFAHRQLQFDAVYVSEFSGGQQVFRAVAGDANSFRIAVDEALPADVTYGQSIAVGQIASVGCREVAFGKPG